jgi:hypothetical protein
MDWDATVMTDLKEGDYLHALCGMLPDEDAMRLRAIRPTIGSMLAAIMQPAVDANGEESSEPSPGESRAS